MKFVTFQHGNAQPEPGLLTGDTVVSLEPAGFANMLAVITAGDAALAAARSALAQNNGIPLSQVKLLAPLPDPPRIFAIGLNYASHAAETQMKAQSVPTVFMKLSSSVTGPETDILLPSNSKQPDYEAELAVVIGRPGYRIAAADWQQYVFGYTILNDVSARDIQMATSQWTLGKSYPTFAPLGPTITSADEIPDPHALDISLSIEGETLQQSNTRDLLFRIPQLIEYISAYTPFVAGDIISTGTPEGVGLGRKPPRWLRPDEQIVITIEGLGELRNKTRAE